VFGGLLMLSGAAYAGEYAVESPELSERAAAEQLQTGLEDVTGVSWLIQRRTGDDGRVFVLRAEGVDSLDAAWSLAGRLVVEDETGTVYARRGRSEVQVVAMPGPSTAPVVETAAEIAAAEIAAAEASADGAGAEEPAALTLSVPAPVTPAERPRSVERLLRAAIDAHGGQKGGLVALASQSTVDITYRRTITDSGTDGGEALVVDHRYRRSGKACRLEVTIAQGEGTDSVTILTSDQTGWLVIGGAATERDRERVREMLGHFSPEAVLSIPLRVSTDLRQAPDWQNLQRRRGGGDTVVLSAAAPSEITVGLTSAAFDAQSHRLVQTAWATAAGPLSFDYDDYSEIAPGIVIPMKVRIERGGDEIERLEVQAFTVGGEMDKAIFSSPKR